MIGCTLFARIFVICGLLPFFFALPTPRTLARVNVRSIVCTLPFPSTYIPFSRTHSRYLQCHIGPTIIKQRNNDQYLFKSRSHKKKNSGFLKNKFPQTKLYARKNVRKIGHFDDECTRKDSQGECETSCFVVLNELLP